MLDNLKLKMNFYYFNCLIINSILIINSFLYLLCMQDMFHYFLTNIICILHDKYANKWEALLNLINPYFKK